MSTAKTGPLHGLKAILMGGIGPAPFSAMLLADLGADVVRIDRPQGGAAPEGPLAMPVDVLARGQRSIVLDFKRPEDIETALRLAARADILIEGFRPGVMERLGLGPQDCHARNAGLVYGRVTGWGQDGPLAQAPGHDINYIALSGALHAIGRAGQPPTVPLNLVGDFAGGGMLLAFGILAALQERSVSGKGQVVDAAMTDGAAALMAMIYGLSAAGAVDLPRGQNLLDGGAHFYDSYECADGRFLAVGALEPAFYRTLLNLCGITDPDFEKQLDARQWPELKRRLADLFRTRDRDAWCALLEGTDACVSPVLDMREAPLHPHHVARASFIKIDDVTMPAPVPRFSRTPAAAPDACPQRGEHTEVVLREWGI